MKDQEIQQLRPYAGISLKDFNLACVNCNTRKVDAHYLLTVEVHNYGLTPAIAPNIAMVTLVTQSPNIITPERFAKINARFEHGFSQINHVTTIWPSDKEFVTFRIDLKDPIIADVDNGIARGYLFVRVSYTDRFEVSHITWACAEYVPYDQDTNKFTGCDRTYIPKDT